MKLLGKEGNENTETHNNIMQTWCINIFMVLITGICMILISIICVCITRPTEIALLCNTLIGRKTPESIGVSPIQIDLNKLGMSALEAKADHECTNYLVSKYDETNHWQECTECGTKYEVKAHEYTDTWTMGETCNSNNKCNHICACGYSYQTNNNREHDLELKINANSYRHYYYCNVCKQSLTQIRCTKEDGTQIGCGNLGTCAICNHVYSEEKHMGFHFASDTKSGDAKCDTCGKYLGTFSNIETNYQSPDIFEFSYDLSVNDTGNFNDAILSTGGTIQLNSGVLESHTKTENNSSSIHVTGRINLSNCNNENKMTFNSYVHKYYISADEPAQYIYISFQNISPDIEPPAINEEVQQENIATSGDWATQKRLTITGTENFCSSVKLTVKDSEGNTYLNNAAVNVIDNNWSYTFTPDIEADEAGKEFTITAIDNLGNKSEQTFTVSKTDKKAPTMTSLAETSQEWTKNKPFTFTATDNGAGNVLISVGNEDNYTEATKLEGIYSREYNFTGDIYGSKNVTVYFKDGLGNKKSETIKVYNIDSTAPTITNHEIINKEIVLTGNDINSSLGQEGSGIAGYRYLGSSRENETIGNVGASIARPQTSQNGTVSIPLTEFERVKYAYIQAIDRAGNTSETLKITLPTYNITVNPNGGTWRDKETSTTLEGYQNAQSITIENPEREGYNFTNWTVNVGTVAGTSYTFELEDATLSANWEPKADTVYTVKHWQEKLNTDSVEDAKNTEEGIEGRVSTETDVDMNQNYTLIQTETLHGTTGGVVTPDVKTYPGFTSPTLQELTILADGTAEINYYYTRNRNTPYTVKHWQEKLKTENVGEESSSEETNEDPNQNYTLIDTESLNGVTEGVVTPNVKEYPGFISPETKSLTITADGLAEVNYYYTRRKDLSYTVKYLEKGTNVEIKEPKTVGAQTLGKEITSSSEIVNDIYGYSYDSVTPETLQITTEENIINIYYVKKDAKVIVHHYVYDAEAGEYTKHSLTEDVELTGKVGDTYTTSKSSKITENYVCINEESENSTGEMTEEEIEISYYYELKTPTIENTANSTVKTEPEKDENGNYIIDEEPKLVYVIEYRPKVKDYIGKITTEIKVKLPAQIDTEKSDLKQGVYDPETKTVTWTEETNIDTFEDGDYTEKTEKQIEITYKDTEALKDKGIGVDVEGKTLTYYPEGYLEKGGQQFVEGERIKSSRVIVHHYIYDIEKEKNTKSKLTADEEIRGTLGQDYATQKSDKITKNYEIVSETPTNYTGKMAEDTIEVKYYYKLKPTSIEDNIISKTITELDRDEKGEHIIEKDKKIKYAIEYETKVEDYIGKITIEAKAKLPAEIDPNKSDLKGGIYDKETNTVTWTEERNVDTFENEAFTEKIEKEIEVTYKDVETLKYIGLKVEEKTISYYPKGYIDRGEKALENVKYAEKKTGKTIVKYVDIDTNKEIAPTTYGYEIEGNLGDEYETEQKEIKYYKYVKDSGNTIGAIKEEETVTYYYKKLDFNFKIENTINSIALNGKPLKISNNEVAKIEIKEKEIEKTELQISYNIKVTNDGELKGKATIVEEIPKGYELLNTNDWKQKANGELEQEVELEAGESKNLTLTLKWKNAEENLGSKINLSKITKTENEANYKESNEKDNEATSTIIVSIKTGIIVSVVIIIMIITSLAICVYVTITVARKKGPNIKDIGFLRK